MYPVSASRNWEQLGLKRESPALAVGSVKDLDSREGTRYFKAGALLQGADTHENTIYLSDTEHHDAQCEGARQRLFARFREEARRQKAESDDESAAGNRRAAGPACRFGGAGGVDPVTGLRLGGGLPCDAGGD